MEDTTETRSPPRFPRCWPGCRLEWWERFGCWRGWGQRRVAASGLLDCGESLRHCLLWRRRRAQRFRREDAPRTGALPAALQPVGRHLRSGATRPSVAPGGLMLAGILFSLGWFYISFHVLWKSAMPLVYLLYPDRSTVAGHLIFGACIGRFPAHFPGQRANRPRQPAGISAARSSRRSGWRTGKLPICGPKSAQRPAPVALRIAISFHAGIRRSPEAAVARIGPPDHPRVGRRPRGEVAGYGTAEGAKSAHGPAWRDCRRRPRPCGAAKPE